MMIFTSASVTRSFRSRTPYCVTNDNIFSAICKERVDYIHLAKKSMKSR